jgi:cell division protein FtsW (lipid II flippase)
MNYSRSNTLTKNKRSIFKNDISQVFKLIVEKRVFFALILANLVVQLYITYYVSENVDILDTKDDKKTRFNAKTIAAYIISFILILILALVPMPLWLKFIIFSLFSAVLGVILSSIKYNFDPNTIKGAFVGTISIFVSILLLYCY